MNKSAFPGFFFAALLTCTAALSQSFTTNDWNPQYTQYPNSYPEWSSNARAAGIFFSVGYASDKVPGSTSSRSPANFWSWDASSRYGFVNPKWITGVDKRMNKGVFYMAHRGLVEMREGIAENTLDAVQHAIARGVNIVELDVQATQDLRPMLTHDDNLNRIYADNNLVSSYTGQQLAGRSDKTVFFKYPNGAYTRSAARYCTNGNTLMSVDTLFQSMEGNSLFPMQTVPGGLGGCKTSTELTYFFDPKNLNSGKAVFQFIADSTRSGNQPNKFYVKTYDQHWSGSSIRHDAAKSAERALEGISTLQRRRIQVAPVINVIAFLDEIEKPLDKRMANAVEYATSILAAYTRAGVKTAAVEFPGSFHPDWPAFVANFKNAFPFSNIVKRQLIAGNNPTVITCTFDSITVCGPTPLMPVISYGYRFPDITRDESDGYQYLNWDMRGELKRDTVDRDRGRLGAAYLRAGAMCNDGWFMGWHPSTKGVLYQRGCFVTTDFPLHELMANGIDGTSWTTRATTYQGSPERNRNPNW